MDKAGRTVDFFLSRNRDVTAAKTFLCNAMKNRRTPTKITLDAFYEKVVKVKADVAAILNFFSRSIPQMEADHLDAASVAPIGGMRKGGFSGAL